MKWLIVILEWIFWLLDWWNESKIDHCNNIVIVTYRIRFKKYKVYLPYDPMLSPLIGTIKDKQFLLPQQPGVKLLVSAKQLGYDKVEHWVCDD